MAEQFEPEDIEKFKAENPGSAVVAYINTTAKLKTKCDVCVTSASALSIVGKLEEKDILFIPDPNLGNYVAKNFPEKNIKVINGGCPIHGAIKVDEVKAVKRSIRTLCFWCILSAFLRLWSLRTMSVQHREL